MNKKQKTLLLVAGIISVILAAALIYYFKQQKEKKEISQATIDVYPAMPQVTDTGLVMPAYGSENGGCPAGHTLGNGGIAGGFMCYPEEKTGTTKELMMPLANQEPAKVVTLDMNIPASKIDFSRLK